MSLIALSAQPANAAVECATPSAGLPAISLVKEMPAEQLYSTPIPVTLRASQPAGPPAESGFNLTFRDVLPANVSYVAGSSTPAPTIVNDQPQLGMTTLIWSNVADLAPGATQSLTYEIEYNETIFDAGDTVQTGTLLPAAAAGAYVNCNPRWIPLFNGQGQPIGTPANSASSSATAAPQQTLLKAIEIEKTEPSPESELLRGIHANQTPYTLTVRNNTQRPTANLRVVDYLPAGLEFLGCGTVDNTTNVAYNGGSTQEYPGSGPINPGNAPSFPQPCVTPTNVEFGNFDPDGTGPALAGLYTRVEWNLASTLAANGVFRMSYAAAIPVCRNTMTWTTSAPTPGSLGQTANLNNNNCSGGETVDETALTNYASAFGNYTQLDNDVVPVSDTDDHTVTAEDLAIWKDSVGDEYAVGDTVRWNLHVRTSEYRNLTSVVITDTVPNGMCPVVGTGTPPSGDAECLATGDTADNPTLPWNSATEALSGPNDGTWELVWNLGAIPANQDTVVSFSTLARIYYQSGGNDAARVLATDPLTNEVDLKGNAWPICTNDSNDLYPCDTPGDQLFHTQSPGTEIIDESAATVNSGLPELLKQVASPSSIGQPAVCPAGNSSGYTDGPAGLFRTGDIVCWKLRVDFPGTVSTGGVTLTDFLPEGSVFVPGYTGTGPTANNTVGIASTLNKGSFIDFVLTDPDVDETGLVFEYIIATRMLNTVPDPDVDLPPIRGNLLKMTSVNTAGQVTTYRDQADAVLASPHLAVTKGVKRINGLPALGNAANVDGGTIVPGAPVEYRIDVSNSGLIRAVNSQIVERLVGPYNCSMVSAISNAGTCVTTGSGASALTEITWNGVTVPQNDGVNDGRVELNFSITYPDTIAPGVQIDDNACVKNFQNETNNTNDPLPANWLYTWVVDNPVATCGAVSSVPSNGQLLDGVAINDPSHVTAPGSVAKTVATSVTETNNNAAGEATIGETLTYTVTATIPGHTTVNDFSITDAIVAPTRQVYVAGSAACSSTIAGFCAATSVTHGTPANTVVLSAGGVFTDYTNASNSDQTITLTFQTKVADIGTNNAGGTLTNRATVSYEDQYEVTQSPQTNQTSVTIVEPNPRIVKDEDDADDIVSPGQEVEYTLIVTNPARTGPTRNASPLHETVVTDVVPLGLTPTNGAGVAIADGGTVALCSGSAGTGVWSAGTRTITWTLGTVAPAPASTTLRYCTEIDSSPPPAGGAVLTNTATVTGTSMPGTVTGERTYSPSVTDSVTVAGSALTKTANVERATIGQTVQYTLQVTVPRQTQFYLATVKDTMPAGMGFVSFDSATCAPVVDCGSMPIPTTSVSGQNLLWDYGNVPAHNTVDRTLTITYTARVLNVVGNVQDATLTNSATLEWCSVAGSPCLPANTITTPPATDTVTVDEPNLVIDKDVHCQTADLDVCAIQPGDGPFTYSVTVTNNGASTAFDAIFQDQVPTTLTNVVPGILPFGVTTATPTGANTHAWRIASLGAGSSITITYSADLVDSSLLSDPFTAVNTARVTEYWGLNAADRLATTEERTYPATEPTDTVTLNGQLPRPNVVKTVANSGNAEIGQPLRWTLTISNASAVAALNDINVVDTLPAGWTYVSGSTMLNSISYIDPAVTAGPTLTWTNVGDIAGNGITTGADIVMSFEAMPTMAALDGSGNATNPYTNNVAINGVDDSGATGGFAGSYSDTDSEPANIQLPNLTIAKTPNSATVTAGTWNNWSIVVTNSGPGTARNVVIRDAVPSGLFYNLVTHPATLTCAAPATCSGITPPGVNSGTGPNNISWTLASLASGQSVTLTLPMMVPSGDVNGTTYDNTAYTSSTERPTEINDAGQWTTVRSTDRAITKVGSPATGTAGENITYTLTATNNGPSIATGVSIADTIDTAQFEFVSITRADTVNDTCTTTGSPVVTAVNCSVGGSMAVGETATFTLVLKVKSGLTGSVSNTATVTGTEPDPVPGNNTDTETTPLGTTADLAIVKSLGASAPSSILNHSQTSFTLTVTNNGPSDALSAVVSDNLPDGLSCVSSTPVATSGCAGTASETVTWNLGTIVAGATSTITIVVRGEQVGNDWLNTATVGSATPDSNPSNNLDTEEVDVNPMADLRLYKDAQEGVASGADFDFTLNVTNLGPDSAVTPTITDTLPAGLIYLGYSTVTPGVTCSITGQLFTCTLPTMANGGVIDIDLHVNSGFTFSEGAIVNSASVSSPTPDSDPDNNEGSDSVMVGPNADVAITKSGPAWGAAGHPMQYTLSVINNGPATSDNVIVSDPLPAGLTLVSATPNLGTCTEPSPNVIECALGDMDVGDTAQIVVVATPGDSVVGTTVVNTATVATDTPDGNAGNNTSTVPTPIENNAYPTSSNVALTKTVSDASPRVGDLISYTLVATNQGPDTARAATIVDTLPSGLIYSSWSGDGQCTFASPTLSCQLGDIPNGQSRTIVVQAYVAKTGPVVNGAVAGAANDRNAGDNSAVSPITAASSHARLSITKKASKKTVRVGKNVKFTIKVKNTSRVNAVNVRVCDMIPARMSVIRKDGGKLRSGNLCWDIPVLRAGKSRTFKPVFRISNGRASSVTNPVRAKGTNTRTARAKAKVRVPRKKARAGGTTG